MPVPPARSARVVSYALLSAAGALAAAACLVLAAGPVHPALGPVHISLSGPARLFMEAAVILLLWALWFRTRQDRQPWLGVCSVVALAMALAADSPPRRVGDGAEYVAMALRAARFQSLTLTPAAVTAADARLSSMPGFDHPNIPGAMVEATDGRRVFIHFWLYSVFAAPFVRAAEALNVHPNYGFTALNIALLGLAAWTMARHAGLAATLLVLCGPLLWWVDKAHTELFIVACLAGGLAALRSAPVLGLLACAVATAQNPALLPVWLGAVGVTLWRCGAREPRAWAGVLASGLLCLLHPAYYLSTLGRWSSLRGTVMPHVPGFSELLTPLIDLNLGILVHAPMFAAALALACLARGWRHWDGVSFLGLGAALVTMAIATQAPNANHGGTFNPSRYGVWLLPLLGAILRPLPAGQRRTAAVVTVLASLSLVSSVLLARPERGENYLRHDALAAGLLERWPALYSPLPEVFVERTIGSDNEHGVPVAFGDCSKLLLAGAGAAPVRWPVPCQPAALPDWCRPQGTLCYATHGDRGYVFTPAPRQPAFTPSPSLYAWTSPADFDWLHLRIDWGTLRSIRAGATRSWVRRAQEARYVHTVQSDAHLLAWIEPLDSSGPSVTLDVPGRAGACQFDLVAKARLRCDDLEPGGETTIRLPAGVRSLLVVGVEPR